MREESVEHTSVLSRKKPCLLWMLALSGAILIGAYASSRYRLPRAGQLVRNHDARAVAIRRTLSKGRALMMTRCVECHRLHWPQEFPRTRWMEVLPEMGGRSSLTEAQTESIWKYVDAVLRNSTGDRR